VRFPFGCAAVAGAIAFAASSGCMARAPRVSGAALRSALEPPNETLEPAATATIDVQIQGFDAAIATSTLDHPALEKVKALVSSSDYAGAAASLEEAISRLQPSDRDATRWRYQLGRLRAAAGDLAAAAEAFDEVARGGGPLSAYAQFGAAQALIRAGRIDEGLTRARSLGDDNVLSWQGRLLVAEALELKRDFEGAIEIWRDYLAESRHPPRWIEIALRMADAILEGHPDAVQAEKAALLCRRVEVEAPTSAAVGRAVDMERRALALVPESPRMRAVVARGKGGTILPTDWAKALSFADQLTRATAFGEAQDYANAQKALDALAVSLGPKATTTEVGCRAQVVLGSVLGKLKDRPRSADAYGLAIARCEPYPDALVDALYFGGKASASAGRCDEAIDRFLRVEKEFHDHRFADDARLHAADCALEPGDDKRYTEMLSALPVEYPDGDMVQEGLFRLALRKMVKKEWGPALGVLETAKNAKSKEIPSSQGGRIAYFMARALSATGDTAGARHALGDVLRDYPLSYYMLQAYARLAEQNEPEAKSLLADALAREPAGRFVIDDEEVFHSNGFVRAIELLRQGESDFARREIGKLGLLKEGASSQALWAVAASYARAGYPQISHSFPKLRVFDWLGHYPAGKWREPWEIAYPRPFSDVVEREAKKNGIPSALAYAVMREESAFDPEAVSPAKAFGLMQLIVPTAKKVARDVGIACDETLLARPETNVALGCRFLADLRAKFPLNPHLAVSAYNAGPGAPVRWIASRESDDFDLWVEQIPYEETRRYTKKVLASYAAYAFLYDRNGLDAALRMPKAVAP
jgi:soluble lytic murein transglycosylase